MNYLATLGRRVEHRSQNIRLSLDYLEREEKLKVVFGLME